MVLVFMLTTSDNSHATGNPPKQDCNAFQLKKCLPYNEASMVYDVITIQRYNCAGYVQESVTHEKEACLLLCYLKVR